LGRNEIKVPPRKCPPSIACATPEFCCFQAQCADADADRIRARTSILGARHFELRRTAEANVWSGRTLVAGKVTGDTKTEAEGKADQVKGKVKNTLGGIKDTLKDE
jgi:hypothetical protein